jgi:hypothetical protein
MVVADVARDTNVDIVPRNVWRRDIEWSPHKLVMLGIRCQMVKILARPAAGRRHINRRHTPTLLLRSKLSTCLASTSEIPQSGDALNFPLPNCLPEA